MTHPIPPFYRTFFTLIDPVLSFLGIYTNIFTPHTVLSSYSPHFSHPAAPETTVLLHTVAAFLAGLIFLQIYLLRVARPRDFEVWKAVEAREVGDGAVGRGGVG
ncbi:MAG: hypothetical protein Q9220_003358 [cf. Caloplaca sp. 1 TL-2023]